MPRVLPTSKMLNRVGVPIVAAALIVVAIIIYFLAELGDRFLVCGPRLVVLESRGTGNLVLLSCKCPAVGCMAAQLSVRQREG
ncbi:hypothetical protein N657DRAFT_649839 [Parathielavia appendiculata]|uniref:Uncharacterized protein n=1 Tax=Parathielavia appendiculata TaxID=2587402 RepID=A0AAN6YZB3_9PEZI|nr:hypothetical protein N657DRAFT_649839 [Parathielavia appendiculata]